MEDRYISFCSSGTIRSRCTARVRRIALTALSLSTIAAAGAFAQQAASEACSASGTTSLASEKQLPPEPKPFGGVIKRDSRESKPCWDPRIVPPKGAPNVLLIITDDAGFGVSSTFGGVIPTPATGPHCQQRTALHEFQFHRALLAHARRADHRPQPSLGGLRRYFRTGHRLSGL